jgi:hypothetical protein
MQFVSRFLDSNRKEGGQLEDLRNVGESSCKSGDGTDQRVQSLMFMMMMIESSLKVSAVAVNKWCTATQII